MLTIRDVLLKVRTVGGRARFTAGDLNISPHAFQEVVETIREAEALGYIRATVEHSSSSSGLIDLVVAESVTDEGDEYLSSSTE